jgi:hypothetical protein
MVLACWKDRKGRYDYPDPSLSDRNRKTGCNSMNEFAVYTLQQGNIEYGNHSTGNFGLNYLLLHLIEGYRGFYR